MTKFLEIYTGIALILNIFSDLKNKRPKINNHRLYWHFVCVCVWLGWTDHNLSVSVCALRAIALCVHNSVQDVDNLHSCCVWQTNTHSLGRIECWTVAKALCDRTIALCWGFITVQRKTLPILIWKHLK